MKLLAFFVTFLLLACQSPVFAGTDQWTSNGPFGGGIKSLCRSPQFSTDHTIFAGTGDGFFISTDRGASWTRSNNGLPDAWVIAIAVSPDFATDRTIFIGTEMGGVHRSRDGGATWQTVYSPFFWPGDIAISPQFATDRTVFLVFNSASFKSTDGGDTWESVSLPASTIRFSPDYANDHTLFAGATSGGVYRSTDNGVSWQQVNTGLNSGAYVRSLAISPNYATDRTVFAGTGNGLFVTTNGGDTWSAASGIAATAISLAVSPNFAVDRTVVAGTTSNLYISTDGGINWSPLAGVFGTWFQALLFSPDFGSDHTLFVGSDAGFFTLVNTAGNWSASNSGLGGSGSGTIAVSPAFATDQTLFAGRYGGGVHRSVDGGTSWQPKNNSLGNFDVTALQLSPLFPFDHTVMAGTAGGVFISQDGGNSWRAGSTGLTSLNVTALAVSPAFASDRTIFAGTEAGVFKSTDGGDNWTPASSGLANLNVRTMAISPSFASDRKLLVGSYGGGIAISADAGDSWLSMNSGLYYLYIPTVAFSPAFASDRELFCSNEYGLYRSIDGGNWTAINGNITDTHVYPIAVSPGYGVVDHTLLVSTDSGVFSSTDSGAHWLDLGSYAFSPTFSPDYATDMTLFASGGGHAWKYTYSTKPNFISSVITYPADNSSLSASSITITGTASEGQGYGLQKVEISTDGGTTWQLASGTSNWSYFWSPAEGNYTIKVRATDNNGRVEPVANGILVHIDRTAPTGTIVYDYNNDNYMLNVNANDPGLYCNPLYGLWWEPCGLVWMLLPGSSVWELLTSPVPRPTLPYGTSSLWLRDRAGNTTYINQTTQSGFPVRLADWSLYATIQQAFNSAASGNTIKLTTAGFSESITFGRGIALTLSGGFNDIFSSQIASTTITGTFTVQGDDLELQNINLSGIMTINSGSANLNNVVIRN